MIGKRGTFLCFSYQRCASEWLREWGGEEEACSEYSYTAGVNPPKMESPNGAAKLSRGKQSISLQGEQTNTEVDAQAHGSHAQILTQYARIHCVNVNTCWLGGGNVHQKWVKHWKINVDWHHLNSPRLFIHFNRTASNVYLWWHLVASLCNSNEGIHSYYCWCLIQCFGDRPLFFVSYISITCTEHRPYISCKEE